MAGETKQPFALVTGASGFVGSALVRRLVREGYRVRAFMRRLVLARLQAELGWKPAIDLDQGMERAAAWLHQSGALNKED